MPVIEAPKYPRAPRRPTLATALAQLAKARVPVRAVHIERDGCVTIDVGKPGAANPDDTMTPEDLRKLL
jgi:hypothetical protein